MADPHESTGTLVVALLTNTLVALAKGAAAWVTGSTAMLAGAAHSLADCGNQGLLLLGLRVSARTTAASYRPGHGRAIYFWSFIVALMLFSMCGMFSIYKGLHQWGTGEPLENPWIAVGVLVFSLAVKSVSLLKALTQVNAVRGQQSLLRWFRETRQSELLVVVGEDIAATVGLCFALVAVGATLLTGNPAYDALGSVAIGVLLLGVAIFVGVEVKALLVGHSIDAATHQAMLHFLNARSEVAEVFNLITLQNGADVVVAVKARMADTPSAPALIDAINRCERALRAEFPEVRWLFFEPDKHA